MLGLIIAIVIFNVIAFKTNKRLSTNQIVHIWTFTIAFQMCFDIFIDVKYEAYWYFTKAVDWVALPAHIVLLPPVIMMFLNWYPFNSSLSKQMRYFIFWGIGTLTYELLTLLPEPWGYFHYGWWSWVHTALINPVLFIILLTYYKWICKIEKNHVSNMRLH
jgi:hypothetical protein